MIQVATREEQELHTSTVTITGEGRNLHNAPLSAHTPSRRSVGKPIPSPHSLQQPSAFRRRGHWSRRRKGSLIPYRNGLNSQSVGMLSARPLSHSREAQPSFQGDEVNADESEELSNNITRGACPAVILHHSTYKVCLHEMSRPCSCR